MRPKEPKKTKEEDEETKETIKNFSNILNKLIDENLTEKKHTDSYIAKKTGINRKSIANYRNGNLLPNTKNLLKLSNFFHVSISYLLGITEVRNSDNEHIGDELGINDASIQNLCKIKKINSKYDNKYPDLLNEVFINPKLYESYIQILDYNINIINSNKSTLPRPKLSILTNLDSLSDEEYFNILICEMALTNYIAFRDKILIKNANLHNLSTQSLERKAEKLQVEIDKTKKQLKEINSELKKRKK